MSEIHAKRIDDPSAWTPADLMTDRSWDFELGPAAVDELLAGLERTKRAEKPLARIDREDFPLPSAAAVVRGIDAQLREGRGFALLHGFPVEGHAYEDVERMYWGFCAHLGRGLTQNGDASLVHYVTEGRLRPSQGTRGVGNPGRVSMHVDLADCVSLLCVRQPEDSPASRLASSMTVHNRILETEPAALARLYEGYEWDRQQEQDPAETPTTGYRVPVFSQRNGKVSCRYNRTWMRRAAERNGAGFAPEDERLFDLFDAFSAENTFEFPFDPGDVQFANNYTVLHGRAPHRPAASEATTRVLMRIWFDRDGIREWADEGVVRHGVIRHGRLGWTAADFDAGIAGRRHPRRPADGAPLAANP